MISTTRSGAALASRSSTTNADAFLAILTLCLVLITGGCGDSGGPARELALVDVPKPSLDGLHPRIADQIREQHARLAESVAVPEDPNILAPDFGIAGQTYHAYGFLEAAAACYLNAQRLGIDDDRWSYYLGQIYREQGRLDEAMAQFRRTLAHEPVYAPAAISLARLLRETNRAREAVVVLEGILATQPDLAVAHYVLGQILLDEGDSPGAISSLQAALEAQPRATRIHYLLASAYRNIGDFDRAKTHLRLRGDSRPKFADPLMSELTRLNRGVQRDLEAGTAAYRRGDFLSALRHFRKATSVGPKDAGAHRTQDSALLAEAHHALGSVLARLGKIEEAAASYREALRINPGFVSAHYRLALLQDSLGHLEEAIHHYKQVVHTEPRYRDARVRLAAALEKAGRCEETLVYSDKALGRTPENESAEQLQARCLTARNHVDGN